MKMVDIQIYQDSLIPGRNIFPVIASNLNMEEQVMILNEVIELCNEKNFNDLYIFINIVDGQVRIFCQSIVAVTDYGEENNLEGDELLSTMYYYYVGNDDSIN